MRELIFLPGDSHGMDNVSSLPYVQRVVLCSLLACLDADTEQANAIDVRLTFKQLLDGVEDPPVRTISEADTIRTLNRLIDMGFVAEHRPSGRSPVGKGRPEYSIAAERAELEDTLAADAEVRSLLE